MTRKDEVAPGRSLRLHQSVAQELGKAILSGRHPPGTLLTGEIEQSESLGISRTAYREAMRILVAKGLVESRPRAGTHVTSRDRWNVLDPDMLAWMFMGAPDPAFVDDLFELRGLIEPAAAGLAATRRSQDEVTAMREALDEMESVGLADSVGQAADQRFHRLILQAAGNMALRSLASSVGAAVQWTTYYKQQASLKPRISMPEHRAVMQAIAEADPAAAADAMRVLLACALQDMHIAAS